MSVAVAGAAWPALRCVEAAAAVLRPPYTLRTCQEYFVDHVAQVSGLATCACWGLAVYPCTSCADTACQLLGAVGMRLLVKPHQAVRLLRLFLSLTASCCSVPNLTLVLTHVSVIVSRFCTLVS